MAAPRCFLAVRESGRGRHRCANRYRFLVAPEYRERAVALLRQLSSSTRRSPPPAQNPQFSVVAPRLRLPNKKPIRLRRRLIPAGHHPSKPENLKSSTSTKILFLPSPPKKAPKS